MINTIKNFKWFFGVSFVCVLLGVFTFVTFINQSFIFLNENNLQYLLIVDITLLIIFFILLIKETYKLFSEYTSGNRENALKLYKESLPLLILQQPYRMRLTKLILHSQNLIKSKTVREPLPEIDDLLQKFIIELYDHIKTKHNFFI